jgi:8-oxo-dGTP pyrophosphatase MutT (NUDIX family)
LPHDPRRPQAPSAAYAPRHATDDPDVFLIPEDQLPPGLADRVAAAGSQPAPSRPASTVVLVRDSADGPQVLMLRRHGRAGFAADAWVFPGGVVDAADARPDVAGVLDGPSPAEWARRLELSSPAEAMGYVAAAVREAFEETGILLAHGAAGLGQARAEALRREVLEGGAGLAEVAARAGLRVAGGELLYIAHWITPEPEPRRYDTRFFLAAVTEDEVCVPHAAELTDFAWLPPAEAIARYRAGEMKLLPPTVKTLERLSGFATVAAVRDSLRDEPVPARMPVMERRPDGIVIVLRSDT